MAKIAVVLSGGGVRAAYAVGAMRALKEVHGITPAILVAVSGGACPGVFSLVERYSDMYSWPDLFADPRFISLWRIGRNILDPHFLIDGILRNQAPNLSIELLPVTTRYFIGATDLDSGRPHWFSNDSSVHVFDVLKATTAIVGISKTAIRIESTTFVDGCFSLSLWDCVEKASSEGADTIIIVDNEVCGTLSWASKMLFRLQVVGRSRNEKVLAESFIRRRSRSPYCTLATPKVLTCERNWLAVRHGLDNRRDQMHATIRAGYEDMAQMRIVGPSA